MPPTEQLQTRKQEVLDEMASRESLAPAGLELRRQEIMATMRERGMEVPEPAPILDPEQQATYDGEVVDIDPAAAIYPFCITKGTQ